MENTKVTQEELEKIQELNAEFNKVKMAIADAELQKQTLIRVVDEIKSQFSAHEKLLIEKYGANAVINIQTGEVTQKEN
jgi:septal ring factor EnvC (AmiA/AmiB activator)